jgi:hypothetical protein
VWIYTDNDEFFGGNHLENDPYFTLQTHLIYTVRPGLWAGLSAGYGRGAQSTVNDLEKDDRKEDFAWAISFGYPFTSDWGVKIGYIATRRWASAGNDTDTFAIAVSHSW